MVDEHEYYIKISRARLSMRKFGSKVFICYHIEFSTVLNAMETYGEEDAPMQLHFDVSHVPAHMLADDGPDQSITLTAALSQAAAIQNQADQFHHQRKEKRKLDYFATLYEQNDKQTALQLLMRRKEIDLEESQYLAGEEELAWQVESHYLDMQICVGSGLGLAAMLPNIAIHHAVEFRLMLRQRFRRFSAKYAKLGFDPTGCMLWIGRSNGGEDTWLAWVPIDSSANLQKNLCSLISSECLI